MTDASRRRGERHPRERAPREPHAGKRAASAQHAEPDDLRERSISGVLWSALGTVTRVGLQIVAQILLARLLGPDLFGLFAVAMAVVMLSGFFADIGLAYGLIQKREVTDDDLRFTFTWQWVMGIAITAIVVLAADALGDLVGDARVAPVLAWLAPTCLVNSLAAPSTCLLKRRMDFRWLQLAGIVSYAIGFVAIGIPLALAGQGVHALVFAYLSQTVVQAAMLYARARHPLAWKPWYPGAGEFLRFGATVLATNLVNWFMNSVDRVLIGRLMSVSSAGLYATMSNFVTSPAMTLLTMVQSVLYSAGARAQDSHARLRSALRSMLAAVALLVAPPFVSMALVGDTLVDALYGSKWAGGGAVLTPLACAMPLLVLAGIVTPMLWNSGQVSRELKLQVPVSLAWMALCALLAQTGSLVLVGWGLVGVLALRALLLTAATLRALQMPAAQALQALLAGLATTLLCAAFTAGADALASDRVAWPMLRLAIDIAAGAIGLALSLRLFARWIEPGLAGLLRQLAQRLPGPVARAFMRWISLAPGDAHRSPRRHRAH